MEENTVSKSKQKREERAKNAEKKRRDGMIAKIVGIAIAVILVGLIGWGIARVIIKEANTITASGDYSKEFDDNGYIKGVKALDYVTLCDYKSTIRMRNSKTLSSRHFPHIRY